LSIFELIQAGDSSFAILGGLIAVGFWIKSIRSKAIEKQYRFVADQWTNEGEIGGREEAYIDLNLNLEHGEIFGLLLAHETDVEYDANFTPGWPSGKLEVSQLFGRSLMAIVTYKVRILGNNNRLSLLAKGPLFAEGVPRKALLWPVPTAAREECEKGPSPIIKTDPIHPRSHPPLRLRLHEMQDDNFLARTASALAGCQMVELELKLYIDDAFSFVKVAVGDRLPFKFSGADYLESPLERLIEVFKKLSNNDELVSRLNVFKKERNFLTHRGLSHLMDYDASEEMFGANTAEYELRLEWIIIEVGMLRGAIRTEAAEFRDVLYPPD